MTAVLVAALRSIDAPEALYPLAATALASAKTVDSRGRLLVAHFMLMRLAGQVDDAIGPDDWARLHKLCAQLAAFAEGSVTLDDIALAWLAIVSPEALH